MVAGEETVCVANGFIRIAIPAAYRGGITSIQDVSSGQEFIQGGTAPLYTLQLSRKGAETRTITSFDAQECTVEADGGNDLEGLRVTYAGHDGIDLSVRCSVSFRHDDPLAYWTISIDNRSEYGIRCIRYPVVECRPVLGDSEADDYYVAGVGFGLIAHMPGRVLEEEKAKGKPKPDYGRKRITTAFTDGHYPGATMMQMHTYYDSTAGLYMAAYDDGGNCKRLTWAPNGACDALDFTIEHYYDERPGSSFELPYPIVFGTFEGDWRDAADIYKRWAHKQHWCARKLVDRDDVPAWFKEPRPHLMVISRGGVDRAQATLPSPPSEWPLDKCWPARKVVPMMKRYSKELDTPVCCWLEGWEYIGAPGGPVDIFPPYEGEKSFKEAVAKINEKGHLVSLYLAGLHWCYRRAPVGYYGEERFEREGRPLAALNPDGEVDRYIAPSAQKHFVNLCVACEGTRDLYMNNFMMLMDYGATWIQLDQQVGLYTHPCYSETHDHAPGWGPWMYRSMLGFLRDVRGAAKARNPEAAFTCELACEVWIQEIDAFMNRPYAMGDTIASIPLFEYVYHEYAITYGGDFALGLMHRDVACIKHALACVMGIQNLVTVCEPDYDLDVPEVDHPVVHLMRSIVEAQRTFARDYLVFGEAMRPATIQVTSDQIEFWWPPRDPYIELIYKDVPHVVHSTWRAQDGRVGTVLVNWTSEAAPIQLEAPDGKTVFRIMTTNGERSSRTVESGGWIELTVPALGAGLVEMACD